jgi:acetyl-CoA C-acetyltransferase
MATPVAIVGTGQSRCGKRTDVSCPEMVREAVVAALKDAGIGPDEVQAVVTGSMPPPMEGVNAPHLYWADAVGGVGKPIIRAATCGSTGVSVAHAAFYHVASGLFDVVLAVGAEKMYEGEPQGTMSTVADPFFQRPFLAGAPGIFALQCNQYIHHYGLPEERVRQSAALLSVRNHRAAMDNPHAHIRMEVSVADVLSSRVIAYPVRLLDVCPSSDGACAVVFASKSAAGRFPGTPAWVKGVGYCGEEHFFGDSDKVSWQSAMGAARAAYRMAGIARPLRELDVAELYNPFTFQELLYYECFGFCEPGGACELVEGGAVMPGGDLPCDPSGGVLCTNPIGATGLQRVAEVAMQIRGRAGAHQIEGARTGLAHAMGGMDQFNGVMILGRTL